MFQVISPSCSDGWEVGLLEECVTASVVKWSKKLGSAPGMQKWVNRVNGVEWVSENEKVFGGFGGASVHWCCCCCGLQVVKWLVSPQSTLGLSGRCASQRVMQRWEALRDRASLARCLALAALAW